MVRNRTLAGGGKPKKKGADTSKEAARAPCIQKQVVAESPFWLITGKHSTGRWGRLGDKRRRASSGAVQQNGQDRCASQVLCLLKQFPLKKMQTGTSLAIAGWGVKTSRPQCRGRGAPALVVKLNPACPAAKKKKKGWRPSGVKSPRSLISLRGIRFNTAVQPSGASRKSPRGCGDPGPRNGAPCW